MELLFSLSLICIIVLCAIVLLKKKKNYVESDEVKCLMCEEPLISSNYTICYKCRNKNPKYFD